MMTELFTYEIIDPKDQDKKLPATAWWKDNSIMVVCDSMKNRYFSIFTFAKHLRSIGFPEHTILIVRKFLANLSQCEETLP